MTDKALPIFELPLVLLPGEALPLHIFEERYKAMIGHCLEADEPFGVVLRDEDGARSVGCSARVREVLERLPDGRLNILTVGDEPFRVLDRFDEPEWPAAEIKLLVDSDAEPDEPAAQEARAAFADLAEKATGTIPDPAEVDAASAYDLAARVELPTDAKQRLLESRDEGERMALLANALRAVSKALERAEEDAGRAQSNGKVPGT